MNTNHLAGPTGSGQLVAFSELTVPDGDLRPGPRRFSRYEVIAQ